MRHASKLKIGLSENQIIDHKLLTRLCEKIKIAASKGSCCLFYEWYLNPAEIIYLTLYGYRVIRDNYNYGYVIYWRKS